jgi:flagellar biosynthetic protein FliR
MDIQGIFLPVLQTAMVLLRVGALWMFFPVFGQGAVPAMVRLAGALSLSLALVPAVSGSLPAWTLNTLPGTPELAGFALREFVIGAGMGLVSRWGFASCVAAAHWVGTQMGFSAAGLFDPEFHQSDSSWAEFHNWIAVMLFLGVGGHYLLLQAVVDSYGFRFDDALMQLTNTARGALFWTEVGSRFFVWMLKLAAPLAIVLLLIQGALGVLSKFVPQMNVWSVSMPITLGVGVLVFTIISPMYGDVLGTLFNSSHEMTLLWTRFLGAR